MSAAFKVGEVAIMCNCVFFPEYNGVECEITTPLTMFKSRQDGSIKPRHKIKAADGRIFAVEPHKLRKKQPPRSAKAIMREVILKAKEPVREPA